MQAIFVLIARAVLVGFQVLEGEHFGILALAIVRDFHFARVRVARGHHSLGLEVQQIAARREGNRDSRFTWHSHGDALRCLGR